MRNLLKRTTGIGRTLFLFSMLFILPSLYSLGKKTYAILTHDRVEASFKSYEGKNAPVFEYEYKKVKQTYQGPGSDLFNYSSWDTETLIIDPENPQHVFMYHYVDFLILPLFGLGFGGFWLMGFFWTLGPNPNPQPSKVEEKELPHQPHKFAHLFAMLNLSVSRLLTIYYFFCGFFFPYRHEEVTRVLPWIYVLEFFMCHSGVMMVAIPNSLRSKGKFIYHASFVGLTLLYLLFVMMIGGNNLAAILQIYLGVVINRFIMHFDENEEAKGMAMGFSGIAAILFLLTIAISASFSFIPEGGITPTVSAELFADFRKHSSADAYRLVFGGMVYFTLLFLCEFSILRKQNVKK